jgi:RNA polymerase sigma factor (sigma-70 family)
MIGRVRRVAAAADSAALPDRELLESFLAHSDEAAFAVLLRRHGPMVLGVCRRLLPECHDAEDAFQATFLVLVRKAHVIDRRELLANWLYGVASRTARKARVQRARQRCRERLMASMSEPQRSDATPASDLRDVLDQELGRLPEKYRVPLVLCELEGCSRQEAAQALRIPEGTLSSRLSRGRQLLARRLTRRGVTLSLPVLAATLAESRAAAVSFGLLETTARAAATLAVGGGATGLVSGQVLALTEGVLRTMTPLKLKIVLAVLLTFVLLGVGLWPRPAAMVQAGAAAQAPARPAQVGKAPPRPRSVILLWMSGGPSQFDTFDLKPGHVNGGPFKEIATAVKDIRISEHLPRLAKLTDEMVLIRSLQHGEGSHERAAYLMHTGYPPAPGIQYPAFGSVLARELGSATAEAPYFVRINGANPLTDNFGPGLLGPRYAALPVNVRAGGVDPPNLDALPTMYKERAPKVRQVLLEALDLKTEKAATRAAYGETPFGQGCLVARRLVECGVPVVEVALGGWDTHADNFTAVERQSRTLDAGWSTLLAELKERKLLDTTLIVWSGEFGRTPVINRQLGRDHWPKSFTVVLAGGGIKGGQVIGRTDADGQIQQQPVSVPEYLATVCAAMGVDASKRYPTEQGVLVPIVAGGAEPIREALAAKKGR